jgi:uncharacterized membrane protein SpoIIM required for sporulation
MNRVLPRRLFCDTVQLHAEINTYPSSLSFTLPAVGGTLVVQTLKEVRMMNTDKILAEAIAKDYAPKQHSKIIALKKLDNRAKLPATIFTYTWGIVSALIFGTGMSLGMQVIGNSMVLGIVIGIIGLIGCGVNYPLYKKMLEKGKAKYAYEIVQLAREIADQ